MKKNSDFFSIILIFKTRKVANVTCKGHNTVVSLSAGNNSRPAEAYCYDRGCFIFFHPNWFAVPKFWEKKNLKKKFWIYFSHPRMSFFFTRIGSHLTKILGKKNLKKKFEKFFLNFFSHPRVSFFFTGILARWDQNSGFLKKKLKVLSFWIWFFDFFYMLECNYFSPEF